MAGAVANRALNNVNTSLFEKSHCMNGQARWQPTIVKLVTGRGRTLTQLQGHQGWSWLTFSNKMLRTFYLVFKTHTSKICGGWFLCSLIWPGAGGCTEWNCRCWEKPRWRLCSVFPSRSEKRKMLTTSREKKKTLSSSSLKNRRRKEKREAGGGRGEVEDKNSKKSIKPED